MCTLLTSLPGLNRILCRSAQFTLQSPVVVQFAVNIVQFSDQMNEECKAELLSILREHYGDSIAEGKTIGPAYE